VVAITSGVEGHAGRVKCTLGKNASSASKHSAARKCSKPKALDGKLRQLTMRMAEGSAASPMSEKLLGRKFGFPANDQKIESVTLKPGSSNNGYQLVTQSGWSGKPNRLWLP